MAQGDDRAVEVLLRLARGARLDSSSNGVVQCIEESLALAQQLRFDHIERRLRWALDIASSGDGRAIIDTSLLAAADEFLPCNDKQQTQEQPSASNVDVYPDAEREKETESYSRSGDESPPVIGLCECAIDRIDIADLDASRFHRDYVSLNRAVAIRGSIGPDVAARWTVDNLLRDFGHIQVRRPLRHHSSVMTLMGRTCLCLSPHLSIYLYIYIYITGDCRSHSLRDIIREEREGRVAAELRGAPRVRYESLLPPEWIIECVLP